MEKFRNFKIGDILELRPNTQDAGVLPVNLGNVQLGFRRIESIDEKQINGLPIEYFGEADLTATSMKAAGFEENIGENQTDYIKDDIIVSRQATSFKFENLLIKYWHELESATGRKFEFDQSRLYH